MRRLFFVLFAVFCSLFAKAAVTVTISDGINNEKVKSRMERQMSYLLTEVTNAYLQHRELQSSKLGLSDDVMLSVEMLWDNSPFICTKYRIEEHCLTTNNGYQIRNIPLMLKGEVDDEQEAVFSFDKQGNMTSFHLAISTNLFKNVLKAKDGDIVDLRRRELILDYVEQFRTSYNQKDINFLNQVFSDDALIITGKIIKQKRGEMRLPDRIEYKKQTKQEYIANLKRVFAANKQIRATFDDIKVMRHPTNVDFYGVTLRQGYTSDRYHDDGYVFLLWDFTDENAPQIHVRTWQPNEFNGKPLPEKEVFDINDFDI